MGSCSSLLSSGEEGGDTSRSGRVAPVRGGDAAYNSASSPSHSNVVYKIAHIAPRADEQPTTSLPLSPSTLDHPADRLQHPNEHEHGIATASTTTRRVEDSDSAAAEHRLSVCDGSGPRLSLPSSTSAPSLRMASPSMSSPLSTAVHLSLPVSPEPCLRDLQSSSTATTATTDSPSPLATPPPSASPLPAPFTQPSSHARHASLSILQVLRETNHSRSTSVAGVDGIALAALAGSGGEGMGGEGERDRSSWGRNRKGSSAVDPEDVRESEEEESPG